MLTPRRSSLSSALRVFALAAVAAPAHADPARVVFRHRTVDLAPFFEAFPYSHFAADYDAGQLVYFRERPDARELWSLPLGGESLDLSAGRRIGTVDWTTRGMREIEWYTPRNEWLVLADRANDESFNVYSIDRDTGAMTALTDKPYIYGFGVDKQNRFLGTVTRYSDHAPYRSCMGIQEIVGTFKHEFACDDPSLTFTWTSVNFRPDGSGAVVNALKDSDRSHETLVYVDFLHPLEARTTLLDPTLHRRNVETIREWIDPDHFVFTTDESGFTNVSVYDLRTHAPRVVTHLTEDVTTVVPFQSGGHYLLGAFVVRPQETELFVFDSNGDGTPLARQRFDATLDVLDHKDDRAVVHSQSRSLAFAIDEIVVRWLSGMPAPVISVSPRATTPPAVAAQVQQCRSSRVTVPTFDVDPRTHRTRELHAYLQSPVHPSDRAAKAFGLVQAFYGGANVFDTGAQILCALGATVLSPAVRGSTGFGAEFAALNDHDLGGDEAVDLVYAARWLARTARIPEERIGVYGASHGGYEAMRALSLPGTVNGHAVHFPWAFGISWYGFSDILTFHAASNIPDWVTLEAGDPVADRDRLLDRSPRQHPERFAAPLLLLHGARDNRVPVTESRAMYTALRAAHRSVRYVEFPTQGHGIAGVADQVRAWATVVDFLGHDTVLGPTRVPAHGGKRSVRVFGALGVLLLAGLLAVGSWIAGKR